MFTKQQQIRYERAMHAMQSGVAAEQELGSICGSPKSLRVGVNSAMVETSVLAKLLIEKGVVSEGEFAEMLITTAEEEVARYETRLSKRYGTNVKLL